MRSSLSRRVFLAGSLCTAAAVVASRVTLARTPSRFAMPASIRVKLFSGVALSTLEFAGTVPFTVSVGNNSESLASATYDVATGNLTGSSATVRPGSDTITITSSAPIAVTALLSAPSGGSAALSARHYAGKLLLSRVGSAPLVINSVDVDAYIASILASEVSPGWALESLKAQAIVSRTYAVRAALRSSGRLYDVTDDTSNQVYRGLDGVVPSFVSAASDTSGMVVLAAGEPADVFYSAACGGYTASSMELTGQPGPSYLNGVPDTDANGQAYCARAPFYAWENTMQPDALARVLDISADEIVDLEVKERWTDGRVKTLRIPRLGASALDIDGRQFYTRCAALLGYKVLPSALFEVERTEVGFVFKGHGLGHGVGMCQWGARGRADAGMNAVQILRAYFPGTTV